MNILAVLLALALPLHEEQICREVAREYGLSHNETTLLMAIRVHESGAMGLEFGVGGPIDNGHPAHRFAVGQKDRTQFNAASFRCQARWAAGTIRKRYDGDLLKFARIYCPHGAWNWYRNVSSLMWRLRHEKGESK